METNSELNELCRAVDVFAEAMKARLTEKSGEGYSGWKDMNITEALRRDLNGDSHLLSSRNAAYGDCHLTVDIANRAMMLWWHTQGTDSIPMGKEICTQ